MDGRPTSSMPNGWINGMHWRRLSLHSNLMYHFSSTRLLFCAIIAKVSRMRDGMKCVNKVIRNEEWCVCVSMASIKSANVRTIKSVLITVLAEPARLDQAAHNYIQKFNNGMGISLHLLHLRYFFAFDWIVIWMLIQGVRCDGAGSLVEL